MRNTLLLIMLAGLFQLTAIAQTKVGDVTVPNSMKAGSENLVLNGAGMREKLWFDLYVGALYLEQKTQDGPGTAKLDKPMAVKMHIVSSLINKDNMTEAIMEGFEKSTDGNVAPIKSRIDQLLVAFDQEIVPGDIFDLVYQPGTGVTLLKNGKVLTVVTGLDFKQALFGIWLGNNPVDKGLKKGMLSL